MLTSEIIGQLNILENVAFKLVMFEYLFTNRPPDTDLIMGHETAEGAFFFLQSIEEEIKQTIKNIREEISHAN